MIIIKQKTSQEPSIRRIGIIHGAGGSGRKHWQSWLAGQCRNRGLEVYYPKLPESDRPRLSAWLRALEETMPVIDSSTALVCHSLGCATALQLLRKRGIKEVGLLVLVAPSSLSKVLASDFSFVAHFFDGLDYGLANAAIKTRRTALFDSNSDHQWRNAREIGYWKLALDPQVHIVRDGGHINVASGHHTLQPVLDLIVA